MPLQPDKGKYRVIRAGEEDVLRRVVEACAKVPIFGFDTETSRVDDFVKDTVGTRASGAASVGYCLSPGFGYGFYVPFAHERELEGVFEGQMPMDNVFDICAPLLEGRLGGRGVAFNLEFDYKIAKKDGITLACSEDPSVAAKLVSWATGQWDPRGGDEGSRSLKNLTRQLLGLEVIEMDDLFPSEEATPSKKRKKAPVLFAGLDPFSPQVVAYACADPSNTIGVHYAFQPLLDQHGLREIYGIEVALVPALSDMKMAGVAADYDLAAAKDKEGMAVAADLQRAFMAELSEKLGREVDVNLKSVPQLRALFFDPPPEGLGLPVVKRTDNGDPSTDKHVMAVLVESYPIVRHMQTYAGLTKQLGTYLRGYPKHRHPETGRIHSNLKALDTETGRFASASPNLQNQPREGMRFEMLDGSFYTANVRDVIIAGEGFYFIDCDYSQVEYRGMAGEAQELTLIEAFNAGVDVHAKTASLLFGVPLEEITPQLRSQGKTMNFALLYGQGPKALAGKLGKTIDEAQEFIDDYFDKLPAVRAWAERTKEEARRNLYVSTRFGRRRYLPEYLSENDNIRKQGDRYAVNTKIQGVCADIMKIAIVRLHRRLASPDHPLHGRMRAVLTVHDSLTCEVAESVSPLEAYQVMRSAMIFPVEGWPAIEIDAKAGYRYGSLVEFHPDKPFTMPPRTESTEPPPPDDEEDPPDFSEDGPDDEPTPPGAAAPVPVMLEVAEVSIEEAVALANLMVANPGEVPVQVSVAGQRALLGYSSLSAEDHLWRRAVPRARVRWSDQKETSLAAA